MTSFQQRLMRAATASILVVIFALPSSLPAQTHIVSPAELQSEIIAATQVREQNLQTVDAFLSSPAAGKALGTTRLDPQQVKTAVATLNDAELAQLASRAEKAQSDFAAGDLSERDLLLIILGIAVLVLVIVAVR